MAEVAKRMVTSCPECDTHFYVKPEQLEVRKGFVRCGKCQHRFNALSFMLPARDLQIDFTPLDNPINSQSINGLSANHQALHGSEQSDFAKISAETTTKATDSDDTYTPISLEDAITSMPLHTNAIVDESHAAAVEVSIKPNTESPAELLAVNGEQTVADAHHQAIAVSHDFASNDFTGEFNSDFTSEFNSEFNGEFARKKRFKTKQSSRFVAWILNTLALSLLLVLIVQTLYFGRTAITSHIPNVKPYFEQACLMIGCVIELPKDITKISIDDSDLKEDLIYQGLIRVSATIINQADMRQAYPNLELTLTDDDNKPVLRRLFTPKDYAEKDSALKLGLPVNEEVYVNLNVMVDGSAVVGYRLLPRYD